MKDIKIAAVDAAARHSDVARESLHAHPPLVHIQSVAERLEAHAEDNSPIDATEARALVQQLRAALAPSALNNRDYLAVVQVDIVADRLRLHTVSPVGDDEVAGLERRLRDASRLLRGGGASLRAKGAT